MTDIALRTEAKEKLELVLCPKCWTYAPRAQFVRDLRDYQGKRERVKWYARCERCRDG